MGVSYRMSKREFLNLPNFYSGANVIARVEDTSGYPNDSENREWTYGDYKLEIYDCYKRIHVYVNLSSPEERENSVHKLDLLLGTIQEFRDAIAAEVESIESRPEEVRNYAEYKEANSGITEMPYIPIQDSTDRVVA